MKDEVTILESALVEAYSMGYGKGFTMGLIVAIGMYLIVEAITYFYFGGAV